MKILEWLLPIKGWYETESPFQSLTPTEDAEDIKTYSEAMDFALLSKNKDIRNIAVTGQYGAGKSSFLRTYVKEKNKKDVLWVSLAFFLDQASKDEKKEDFEHKLELSILQQMFHVRKESTFWCWKIIIILVSLGLGIVGMKQPDVLVKYVAPSIHTFVAKNAAIIFWLSCLEVSAVSVWALRSLIFWFKSLGITRLEVNGAGVAELGIELPDKPSFSILNHNVSTIINFFATTQYATVIFEDIDRFNDLCIFTKLRELNLLLNNGKQIKEKKKPIRFIYALREELFKDEKNKVKFFDFVIPIIPRVNASTSRTELLSFLQECGDDAQDESLKRFVKEISPYISDMRLLKNICNEYYTYKEQIIDITSTNELLGLIVFKNFFPEDFALMHDERGMMWKFLERKKEAQERVAKEIDDKINALRNETDCINGEKLTDIKQLQLLYYATLMREFDPRNAYVHIQGEQRFASAILHDDDWFDVLRRNGFSGGPYGNRPIKWADIEKETDPNCTYDEHVKRIESRQNGRIENIKQEIQGLKERRLTIKRKTIQELMGEGVLKDDEIKSIIQESSKDRQDAELVVLLLKNGYLNEKYYYNISIFHEVDGVNSIQDYLFEVGVTRGDDADWKTKLKNPRALIESLELHYFSTPSMLNYDICRELLTSPESEKAKEFWQLISRKDLRGYEFVDGYLAEEARGDDSRKLFDCIMSANQNYMAELIETSVSGDGWPREFVEKQLGLYVAWTMRQEKAVVPSNIVKEYVEQTAAMPQLLRDNGIDNVETMTAFVRQFNLKFAVLDFKLAQEIGFIDVVISECAYLLDANMLKGLLNTKGIDVSDFEKKNYSVIKSCGIKQLVDYVDREFKTYLGNVCSRLELQQEDSIENIAFVFNRDDLGEDDITRFVEKQSQQGRIDDAKKLVSDRALALGIRLKWLVPTWNNADEVWKRNKDDEALFWEYVNDIDCYSTLSQKNSHGIAWEKDENLAKRLAEEVQLSDDAMNGLLSGMSKGVISEYSGANATPKRVEYLAKGNRIKYSNELYQALRDIGNDSHIVYATMFIKEFCNEYSDGMAKRDDVEKLFASDKISRRNIPMVVNTVKDVVLDNEDLIIDVASYINVGNFTQFDESILDAVVEKLSLATLQCKIIQHLGGDTDEIRNRLKRMSEPYNKLGELGCHPQISKWDGVEAFMAFLKGKGIVSSTSEKADGKIQVNTTQS
ncbi:MAG: hypothetical protein IJI54_08190 [Kiritimatiellae bacterium]|nr:hypothetical protein [Kiritimatiellia bacterium]